MGITYWPPPLGDTNLSYATGYKFQRNNEICFFVTWGGYPLYNAGSQQVFLWHRKPQFQIFLDIQTVACPERFQTFPFFSPPCHCTTVKVNQS